jgi:hypothetical protein
VKQATAVLWAARYDADPAGDMRSLVANPASKELQISLLPFPELLLVSTLIN